MPYNKGNLIKGGGTVDKCCKTCCELDSVKSGRGGYCVHEGAVDNDDICPLYLAGDWNNRFELRKRANRC